MSSFTMLIFIVGIVIPSLKFSLEINKVRKTKRNIKHIVTILFYIFLDSILNNFIIGFCLFIMTIASTFTTYSRSSSVYKFLNNLSSSNAASNFLQYYEMFESFISSMLEVLESMFYAIFEYFD